MLMKDWSSILVHIVQFEQEGLVTRTFRRLDPEKQQAIVYAILEEANQKGPSAINIKEVARTAGVSIGSLYQYFGSRDGLLNFAVALCVRYMVDMFNQFSPILSPLPLRDALRYYLLGGIEWGQMEQGLVRFFGQAAYHGDTQLSESVVRPIAAQMRNMMMEILTRASERGEISNDIDLEATARVINALILAVGDASLFPHLNNYYQISDDTMPVDRVIDALIHLVMAGIAH
jgi:TetR/AcrR family transcriptional regulator